MWFTYIGKVFLIFGFHGDVTLSSQEGFCHSSEFCYHKKHVKYQKDTIDMAAFLRFIDQAARFLSKWHATCFFKSDLGRRLFDSFVECNGLKCTCSFNF